MYFWFFKLKKWGKKTAETRRRNCAVLPWGLSENRKYDQRRGIFRLLGTIFLQEYFAYCKKKWCPAGGKGPLFGRVDGFQIDPNTSECTNLRKTKLQRT